MLPSLAFDAARHCCLLLVLVVVMAGGAKEEQAGKAQRVGGKVESGSREDTSFPPTQGREAMTQGREAMTCSCTKL